MNDENHMTAAHLLTYRPVRRAKHARRVVVWAVVLSIGTTLGALAGWAAAPAPRYVATVYIRYSLPSPATPASREALAKIATHANAASKLRDYDPLAADVSDPEISRRLMVSTNHASSLICVRYESPDPNTAIDLSAYAGLRLMQEMNERGLAATAAGAFPPPTVQKRYGTYGIVLGACVGAALSLFVLRLSLQIPAAQPLARR